MGLPASADRQNIFDIHLRRLDRDPQSFQLDALAKATKGYSGAEIEQVLLDGLFRAFHEDRELNTDDIIDSIRETVPLAQTRAREITALAEWAQQNARPASPTSTHTGID